MKNDAKGDWGNDKWHDSIQKAQQNLDAAEILFKQGFISLSAFHVQQCVELAIKASAYKFGFDQYLQNGRYAKSHIPAGELIFEVYGFVENQLEVIIQSKFDNEFCASISEAMDKLKQFTGLLRQAKNQHDEKFIELWVHSLGIDTSERIVTALEGYQKWGSTKLVQQLIASTLALAQEFITNLFEILHLTRQKHIIYFSKRSVGNIFSKYGLSDKLVDAFFDNKSEFKKIVLDEIDKHGLVKMMDILLGHNGLLNELKIVRSSKSPKLNTSIYIKFIWIAHLATISPIVLLLYPHTIVGRYPRHVSAKTQNLTTSQHSEKLYIKHATAISELIDEAWCVTRRVQLMLDT